MTPEEIKLLRLSGQHLLAPTDTLTAVKDLCGVQSQFLSHALHGLAIRCDQVCTDGLVKSWTNRGTMHLFSKEDFGLFFHEGRKHTLRPVDTMEADAHITALRKSYFADMITEAVSQGICQRDRLKSLCEKAGMTEGESKSVFDPWGGTIRALCEAGILCHQVREQKAYQLCPAFTPMTEEAAWLELARRYFSNFGPATIKDAAYFFGSTQAKVRSWLARLPVQETVLDGKIYFHIPGDGSPHDIPPCLFLAGFDQLLLGYDKADSLFLPKEHIRDIFNLAGFVRPAVLVNGTVVGWWNQKKGLLTITLFSPADRNLIADTAARLFPDLKGIQYSQASNPGEHG